MYPVHASGYRQARQVHLTLVTTKIKLNEMYNL